MQQSLQNSPPVQFLRQKTIEKTWRKFNLFESRPIQLPNSIMKLSHETMNQRNTSENFKRLSINHA